MTGTLQQRMTSFARQQAMLPPGSRVGVAVSGGADSVALLLLLHELRADLGLVLHVLHFNHRLRGTAADADQQFVCALAGRLGLPCTVESGDVAATALAEGRNLEDTARRLRYAFFQRVVAQTVDRVAVAHTADDQAETVLMHLLRGTGLTGLGGIHPVLGRVVRPLLRIPRSDLRAYLTERGEAWCEDVSNADTSRLRARIRHRLLPLLAAEFEPAAAEHLAALAELAREDDAVLAALAEEACRGRIRWSEGRAHVAAADLLAPTAPLTAVPAALAGRMVRHVAAEVLGYRPRFSRRHVADVLHLARGAGKRVELPGMTVVLQSGELCFAVAGQESRETAPAPSSYQFVVDLAARGELDFAVPDTAQHVRVKVIDWPVPTGETRRASEALDRNLLQEPLVLRNWRPGDTYRPLGRRSAHKLKRLFGEGRVPAIERPAWPVLVAGDQLVWARRFGVAAAAAAGPKTRTAVLVSEEKA